MKLDYDILMGKPDILAKSKYVDEVIAGCEPGDPLFLSDAIVRGGREGSTVLYGLALQEEKALLERKEPMLWKLLVIQDEWGDIPQPGDIVYKVNKKSLKRGKKLISSNELNVAKMDGSYDKLFEERRPYVVDAKGCIECSFTDAGHFLQTRGKHSVSNRPITTQRDISTERFETPDGRQRHIHYWLYREITKKEYETLPDRKPEKDKYKGNSNGRN